MPPTDCAIYHDMVHPDEEKGTNKSKGKQPPPQNNAEPRHMFLPSGKCREREKFWKYQASLIKSRLDSLSASDTPQSNQLKSDEVISQTRTG